MTGKIARDILATTKADAILVTSPESIIYLTGYGNFSKEEREAFLLITLDKSYIFTDGRYKTAIQKQVNDFIFIEIGSLKPFYDTLSHLLQKNKINSVSLETDNLTVKEYSEFNKIITQIKSTTLKNIRVIKKDSELKKIKTACKIADEAFIEILSFIKTGITEKELATEFEYLVNKKGVSLSFETIVAFGKNSAIPHHETGSQKLKINDIILIDCGVNYKNYCSDMTRTFFFGSQNNKFKKIYSTVKKSQMEAIEYIKKNLILDGEKTTTSKKTIRKTPLLASSVDRVARNFIVSEGFQTIPHSLGHGIGIRVHESPSLSPTSKDILTEGMVFSIEPGIYLPDLGGVRIEDLFTIKSNKLLKLTDSPLQADF